MAPTHVTSGVAAGLATAPALPTPAARTGWVLAVAASALLPDVDHPRSKLGRRLRPLSDVVAWAAGGHRAATHSLLGVAVLAGATFAAVSAAGGPLWLPLAVALGCTTHIALDTLTRGGCPLLWPDKHRYALTPFRTGGLFEYLIVLPVLLVACGWAISGWGTT